MGNFPCFKQKFSITKNRIVQGRRAGIYNQENDLLNGRNYWRSQTGNQAIWFMRNAWAIGLYEDRGTPRNGIWTVQESSCPNQEGMLFQYHNGHATSGDHYDAPIDSVFIECL